MAETGNPLVNHTWRREILNLVDRVPDDLVPELAAAVATRLARLSAAARAPAKASA